MKLILYIGHHKVGSTALQTFFSQNSFRLLESGTLYPPVESEGAAYLLGKTLQRRDIDEDLPLNIREPHNALAFRIMSQSPDHKVPGFHPNLPGFLQMALMIRNMTQQLAPKQVVLCSEVLSNFGAVNPDWIDQLIDALEPDELVIYSALRRPDAYLTSWHGQRLKFGHHLEALRDTALEKYWGTIHFNYRKMLEPWITRTPQATWILRDYQDILEAGGSTEDFLAQTGITVPEGALKPRRANPSIPRALMEMARRANIALPGPAARALRDRAIQDAGKLSLPANSSVEMYGAENRRAIHKQFQPIEAWLAEQTGQERFFDSLDLVLKQDPIPELIAAQEALEAFRPHALASDIPDEAKEYLSSLTLTES